MNKGQKVIYWIGLMTIASVASEALKGFGHAALSKLQQRDDLRKRKEG